MKDELNNYKINNPDGTSSEKLGVRKQRFDNDDPRHVKEDSLSDQEEVFRTTETFDDRIGSPSATEKEEESVNTELSESTSTMASASASAGGSIGALAGIVAASVAAIIVVVAVFVSTLSINLSLVMADMHSLVFEVEMRGAQEEDFEEPIYAILTGPEETYREQQIYPDSLYVTFDDLEPDQEYLVVIKNSSKEFVKKSFFTARSSVVNGQISSHFVDNMVFVSVNDVSLSAGEYYTLLAKDAKGNVLFSKDDTNSSAEYCFSASSKEKIYFSLIINDKARTVSTLEVSDEPEPEPEETTEYDFDNPSWTWDEELVTVTFTEKNGRDPLVLEATLTVERIEATCEVDGQNNYTATVEYGGQTFTDTQTETVAALGHVYGEWVERVNATSTTEANGVMPHYECTVCHRCFDEEDNEIFDLNYRLTYADPTWAWTYDSAGVPIKATATFIEEHGDETVVLEATDDHLLDRLVSSPDCETPGYYYRTAYVMLNDGYYDNSNNPDYWSENYIREPALGHDYGDLIPSTATCEEDGMKEYYECSRCHELFVYEQGEYVKVEEEDLVISAFGHDYGDPIPQVDADCEHTGLEEHYECSRCHELFVYEQGEYVKVEEEDLVISAFGHDYGDPIPQVDADCERAGLKEHYECSRCGKMFVYEGGQYTEVSERDLIIPALGELILLDPTAISPVMTVGQEFVGRSVIFMTADKSATVSFGAENNTSKDVNQYSVFTILYVNSAPSIVLTYTDGENTYYLNTTELGGIIKYDLTEREEGSYDQILFKTTNENRAFVRKDFVEYYFVYDVASESIVLTSDVSEVAEDNYVYMYVLPSHAYGDVVYEEPATCEEDGMAEHYHCTVCGKWFDADKNEVAYDDLIIEAHGHEYVFNSFVWDGYTAKAKCICEYDSSHVELFDTEIESEVISEPTCTSTGFKIYTATFGAETDTAEEVLAMLEHTYGDLIQENYNDNGLKAHYECSVCHKLFDENHVEKTAQQLAIGVHVASVRTAMVPENSDHPTADLFPNFEPVDFDIIKNWHIDYEGEFFLIYGFDDGGFYYATFVDGEIYNVDQDFDDENTNVDLHYLIIGDGTEDGYCTYYYTVGAENGETMYKYTKVTSSMVTDDLVGKKVVLSTSNHVHTVDLEATNNTGNGTCTEIKVAVPYPGAGVVALYLSSSQYLNISDSADYVQFNATSQKLLQVDSDGILSNTNYLVYAPSAGKIRMVADTTDCEIVYMYLRTAIKT